MSEPKSGNEDRNGLNRVGMKEFLWELDTAKEWMLWVSPTLGEVELFVKGADGEMRVYHGPNPVEVKTEEYKAFLGQVEKISDGKEADEPQVKEHDGEG